MRKRSAEEKQKQLERFLMNVAEAADAALWEYWREKEAEHRRFAKDLFMAFFNSAVDVLQTLVVALGAGLGIWGVINLMEGYGNDNPGAKSQGMKQFMAN